MAPDRLYRLLIRGGEAGVESLGERARPHVAANALRQMAAQTLQSVGDQVVNAKTVLPWLLSALGAPARSWPSWCPSGNPARCCRRPRGPRGCSGGACASGCGSPERLARRPRRPDWRCVAATASGDGWPGVLAAFAVFALARSLSSLAGKDVLGRTVPKGQRGQIKGVTTVASGAVALTLGLALRVWGGDGAGRGVFAVLLGAAALAWVGAPPCTPPSSEPPESPSAAPATGSAGVGGPGLAAVARRRCVPAVRHRARAAARVGA